MNRLTKLATSFLFLVSLSVTFVTASPKVEVSGELKKWHKISLTMSGPETSEMADVNPFMNYRLNATFTHKQSGRTFVVPGYYAADGNAKQSAAVSGDKWRVHFVADAEGEWSYSIDFRKDNFIAVRARANAGKSAGFFDGAEGTFSVAASDKSGRDNRGKGFLRYDGTRYLKFAENNEIFLKVGPDSPENFLSYADFDGTQHRDGHRDNLTKSWESHLSDWKEGDPTWRDGKGKAIIGAINYLASKGLNSFSFLTMNIAGDDQNVFPYVDYDTYDRFDCSKLDQWEVVFEHGDRLGMFMHFKLMEVENQGLLDNGGVGALTQLYYREMMARFGHHLAMNWNICEEGGDWEKYGVHKTAPMETQQRLAAAQYFHDFDPYKHHIVIHNGESYSNILGPDSKYTGASLQTTQADFSLVHKWVKMWLDRSKQAGKQWAVACDEPGDPTHALIPDAEDAEHNLARLNGLWGAFMAGAWGTEWYFGYAHPQSDLSCQDYRSRDLFWDQCRYLHDFFLMNELALGDSESMDSMVGEGDYCLGVDGQYYIVFLRSGSGEIDLTKSDNKYSVMWYNPRSGGKMQSGKGRTIKGGKVVKLAGAPSDSDRDWVVLLRKI